MQMIDLMKRLAELDAKNSNVVSEVSQDQKADEAIRVFHKAPGDDSRSRADKAAVAANPALQKDRNTAAAAMKGLRRGDPSVNPKDLSVHRGSSVAREDQDIAEDINECGMMGGMSQPHSPASINMTAATGEELSAMLKDIMTLAGRPMDDMPVGEPMGGADGLAVVDMEPGDDVGEPEVGPSPDSDEPSIMRSMIDRLNPETSDDSEVGDDDSEVGDDDSEVGDDDSEVGNNDEEEKKVDEYNNSPDVSIAGYGAAVPSGNDLHKEKNQYPATQPGDNPMAATFESLMAEYKKFIGEGNENLPVRAYHRGKNNFLRSRSTKDHVALNPVHQKYRDDAAQAVRDLRNTRRDPETGNLGDFRGTGLSRQDSDDPVSGSNVIVRRDSTPRESRESMNESVDILYLAGLKKKVSEVQGSRSIEKPNRPQSADDDGDYDLTDKDAPYYVGWSGQSLEWYGDEHPSTGQGRYKPKGDGGRIVAINVKEKEDAEKIANQLDDAYRVGNFEDDAVYGKYGQDGYLVDYSGAYVIPMSKMDSYDREMLKYDMKAGRVKDYSKSEI